MNCYWCSWPVKAGMEETKRAEFREQPGGGLKVFGVGMPDGPLVVAEGRLVKVEHNKCYWTATRRAERGRDEVQGAPLILDPYADD